MKHQTIVTIAILIFIFFCYLFSLIFSWYFYSQKKKGGKLGYFRLLRTKKATITIAAIAATSTIATTVVIKGVSSGVSGVIGLVGEIAGSTVK
jgi:hypothetical protein